MQLKVNAQPIGVTNAGTGLQGLEVTDVYQAANSQYYDLDNHNSTGVAITADLTYAFVADYGLPLMYTEAPIIAYNDEILHDTGSKVTVIQDPFGLHGGPKVLGSTTPIPDVFFNTLTINAEQTKLYILAPGADNVIVYSLSALENAAVSANSGLSSVLNSAHTKPLDNQGTLTDPGIDIDRSARSLSLDSGWAARPVRWMPILPHPSNLCSTGSSTRTSYPGSISGRST